MYGLNNFEDVIKKADKRLVEWLVSLHGTLNKDQIDLKEINNLVNILDHYNQDAKESYINALLYPETNLQAKIPSLFPVPSTSFQMHLTATITPGSSNTFAWTWNPNFLMDQGGPTTATAENSTFYVNTAGTLTGSALDNNFNTVSLQYNQIPGNIYGSYRVVSASVIVSYIGRMDIASGVLGIGVGLNNQGIAPPAITSTPTKDPNSQIFGQFIQVDNLYFRERTQAPNGVRAIYFPVDNRFTEYLPLFTGASATGETPPGATIGATYYTGFYFAGYGQGIQAGMNTNCIRFDFYINYECLIQPQYSNFLPSTPANPSSVDAIKTAGDLIAASPQLVTKASSDIPGSVSVGDVGMRGMLSSIATGESQTIIPGSIDKIKKFFYKW